MIVDSLPSLQIDKMPAPKSLTNWLQPSTSTKRKRPTDNNGGDIADPSDKENNDTASKVKQAKSSKSSKSKPATPKVNKEAQKLYTDTLKAIDKGIDHLDREVKKILIGSSYAITTDTYAEAAIKHLASAKKLAGLDERLAFNLLLSIADASHCANMNATAKMSGVGDSEGIFKVLDHGLMLLIERREKPVSGVSGVELPGVPHRWTWADADVGAFKTGWPNKQQRNVMYRQKLEWEKERRRARRERREIAQDWVAVALSDLKEERDYLDQYGVREYFSRCIAKLEELSTQS